MRIETKLIHGGRLEPSPGGAVVTPIFQSSTFEDSGEGKYHDVRYIRLSNTPNHGVLHRRLALLENGEAALVASSGMAAISSTLLAFLGAGDHLLAHRRLYGGSHDLIKGDLLPLGISCTFIDADSPETWPGALRPETRAIYVETLTNPLLEVVDLEAVVEFARAHDLISMIDNTIASPINYRPLEHGFDLSIHSATKYLNGHSDIVAGAVIGRAPHIERVKHKLDHLGGSLDPHACFLLERGLKTLALRVRHQNASALRLARFLSSHPSVERVYYPGLETHPRHDRARRWFEGMSGLLSFELKGGTHTAALMLKSLKLPFQAPSLGGCDSLVTLPASTSHAGIPREERLRQGISDALVRISVGLEATEDLIEDFGQALDQVT